MAHGELLCSDILCPEKDAASDPGRNPPALLLQKTPSMRGNPPQHRSVLGVPPGAGMQPSGNPLLLIQVLILNRVGSAVARRT